MDRRWQFRFDCDINFQFSYYRQVIEGTETLQKMEKVETMNERPNAEIKITDCGVCTYVF